MKFTKIPENTFKNIQLNAGIILSAFDVESPAVVDANIIGATSGGFNFVAAPTYSDYGDDIDNCPKNMKELKKLENWEVKLSGNFVSVTGASVRTLVGAGDISGDKITPRNDLVDADFADIWWVGDYSDENNETSGGFIAVHMLNSLNTGGFNIKSTDKGKGQFSFEFTGHYSIEAQDTVPFEVYVVEGEEEAPTYEEAQLTSAGFAVGVKYYTRSGSATSYVYTLVPNGTVYNSSVTYYVKA